MKLRFFLIVLILVTSVLAYQAFKAFYPAEVASNLSPQSTQPSETLPQDEIFDIHFYNAGDQGLKAVPYMSIFFKNLSSDLGEYSKVEQWHEEMSSELKALGHINLPADYKKINPIIADYSEKFTSTKATEIAIEFPKEKKGMLLVKEGKKQ